jgi:hypothetical protein
MHDSPGDLVRMDPVADLREGEPESRQVHNVSRVNTDLDAVPHGEWPPPDNEQPSPQVHQRVFQGDSQARRQKSEKSGRAVKSLDQYPAYQQYGQHECSITGDFPPLVTNLQILRLPPYQLQYQPSQKPEECNACQIGEQLAVKSYGNTGSFVKPYNEILQNFLNFSHDSFVLNCY